MCVCACMCVCVSRISMLMDWFNHILSSPIHPTSLQIFVLHFPCVGYSARFGEQSSKTEQNPASMEFTFCGGWRLRIYSAYHSASHLICQTEKLLEESACLQMPPLIITSPAAAGSLCSFQILEPTHLVWCMSCSSAMIVVLLLRRTLTCQAMILGSPLPSVHPLLLVQFYCPWPAVPHIQYGSSEFCCCICSQ